MKKLIVIIIVLAGVGAGLGAYYMRRNTKEPEVRTAPVSRGDVVQAVQATGTLEAQATAARQGRDHRGHDGRDAA